MQAIRRQLVCVLLMVLPLLSAQPVRAELVAASGAKVVSLTPLRNGLSSITLAWPIDPPTQDRVSALMAGLSSVLSGGTSSRSAYDIDAFLRLKGISQTIRTNGKNLLLTVSAPDDVFPETLVHLQNVLLEADYSSGWYARELQDLALKVSVKSGRPEDVLNEVAYFLAFEPGSDTVSESDDTIRFGLPEQIIIRSGNEAVERRALKLLRQLPMARWRLQISKWAASLVGADEHPFSLPTGTIHFADPGSTEMLILFVKAEEFDDASDQVGANLLMDYVGGNQGSEMFRIIRQDMRAAYDPRSDFIVMQKDRSLLSLSATVEAGKWPEVHDKIREIYERVRAGKIDRTGLEIQYDLMRRHSYDQFFNNPVWGARHYLNEYPTGASGTIRLPIVDALDTADLDQIVAAPETHLPPLDDFLLILIGGGSAPTDAQKTRGHCALPKNTPLRYCLDALSRTVN